MSDLIIIDIGKETLLLVLYLSGPMLILSLVVGLTISIFQAATQINEMTLTFIPKLITIGISLIIFLPFMINKFQAFFYQLLRMSDTLIQ
ncbi:MAG: flagellar biosynthesis protein FliQ [Fibrobacteria bacterium]|nr:flagellar biosynthesis protein FliQ [Fibrobacteria bacterium]